MGSLQLYRGWFLIEAATSTHWYYWAILASENVFKEYDSGAAGQTSNFASDEPNSFVYPAVTSNSVV